MKLQKPQVNIYWRNQKPTKISLHCMRLSSSDFNRKLLYCTFLQNCDCHFENGHTCNLFRKTYHHILKVCRRCFRLRPDNVAVVNIGPPEESLLKRKNIGQYHIIRWNGKNERFILLATRMFCRQCMTVLLSGNKWLLTLLFLQIPGIQKSSIWKQHQNLTTGPIDYLTSVFFFYFWSCINWISMFLTSCQ